VRAFPLDGALLFFDRTTGANVRCDGPETAHFRQRSPRAVQFGITNRCNLACTFCSRDLDAASTWTADDAFALLRDLAAAGVLEVAFGGGEPFAFRGLDELIARLWDETPLAPSVTTNGLLLDDARLRRLRGRYGQIRVSLYDDNDWRATVARCAGHGARFGVNYLVTPARLDTLEAIVLELVALGCRDVLLLSYNGRDPALHLAPAATRDLERRVALLHRSLGARVALKLDVCWGERLEAVPRLFDRADCGAGRDFVVITSDRALQPCSFHHVRIPIRTAADVMAAWRDEGSLALPARDPGCAREPGYGLHRLEQR